MVLKLTEHVGITIFLLYKQKNKNKQTNKQTKNKTKLKTKTKTKQNKQTNKQKTKKTNTVKFRYSGLSKRNFEFSPILRKKNAIFRSGMFYDLITT